ncbi:Ig-like domain-containing protein [Polaribacter sp.]|uniref:Ig-like domain-containing protein n=1 Tax=Polaribacter sp. TaxID=1920175 RepID=UPI004047CA70
MNDAITVAPGSSKTYVDVLANDNFGANGPHPSYPLTLTNGKVFHASTQGGEITVENGKATYTPPTNFSGIDTFTYTITDSKGFADEGIVTVTVGGNVPGLANNDAFDIVTDTTTNLDVLANDTGTGLYIVSFDATSLQGFSVTGNSSSLTYTPTGGFSGTDSFSYTIADANGDETTATVTLTVNEAVIASGPLNAVNDAITVQPGNSNTIIDVLANDSFGENGPNPTHALTLTNGKIFHASVKGGDIAIVNGKVTYTPKNGFTGVDSFDYTITDAKGFADTGYVTVTVGEAQSKTAIKDSFEARNEATVFDIKENSFSTYPNPSKGYLKTTLLSTHSTQARVLLTDVTGKVVYSSPMTLQKGMNSFEMTVSLAPGIVLMKVISSEVNFGTQKIIIN